jgi:hypothetical protein
VLADRLLVWTPSGYRHDKYVAPDACVEVLTPPGITAVMKLGYRPMLHETAHDTR